MLDAIYENAQQRVAELAQRLRPAELDTAVPGCPEWTVRDVVSHLTGVAADALAGRGGDERNEDWTARQVAERRDTALADVLAEWTELTPRICAAIAAREVSARIAIDIVVHEADIIEALGHEQPDPAGWQPCLEFVVKQIGRGLQGPGTLTIHVADKQVRGGADEPVTELRIGPYELFRGLLSRRSKAQMRAWDWDGDPEPYLDSLPVFGPREDDQPLPSVPG